MSVTVPSSKCVRKSGKFEIEFGEISPRFGGQDLEGGGNETSSPQYQCRSDFDLDRRRFVGDARIGA